MHVLEAIFRRPDRTLLVEWEKVPLQEMDAPDPERSQQLVEDPEALCRAGLGPAHLHTPAGAFSLTRGWKRHVRMSHGTQANRTLARLVELLARTLPGLAPRPGEADEARRHQRTRTTVARARRQLQLLRVGPGEAGPDVGAVLQHDPRYRVIRRVLYDLRARLRRYDGRSPNAG